MPDAQRFSYAVANGGTGEAGLLPQMPLTLKYQSRSVEVSALLDTGATVNVMPYQLDIELGASWNQAAASIRLSGNLAQLEAQPLIVSATVGNFSAVRLAFAWTKSDDVPLIMGQVNFFMEFDVCFYRAQRYFEVCPKH